MVVSENSKGEDILKSIDYYDSTGKRYKQVDLNHWHKQMKPHTHHGYYHNENDNAKGATKTETREKTLIAITERLWYSYLNR